MIIYHFCNIISAANLFANITLLVTTSDPKLLNSMIAYLGSYAGADNTFVSGNQQEQLHDGNGDRAS